MFIVLKIFEQERQKPYLALNNRNASGSAREVSQMNKE